ncbi:MAG: LLM class flavin-dependent oxidoreductase [Deltaproteobacteria bacterium]|nr:LLM class flavin-dependent oxidoreductase [Deltaproteobacteria bacterium]
MRVGYQLLFQNGHQGMPDDEMVRRELRLAELAEPLGFDTIWCVEHHFDDYSMCPDNTQLLSYLAGRTQRIHLGTAAVILPWNDPLRVAEKIVLLDTLCDGRLVFGIGRGLARMEYAGFRVDMNEARGRFNEAAKMIFEAIESGVIEGRGPFYPQPPTEIRPRPSRSFRGRTYAVAMSPESAPITAELGARMMFFVQYPIAQHLPGIQSYREHFAKAHGIPAPPVLTTDFVLCDRDGARAEAMARRYVAGYFLSVMRHYEFLGEHFAKAKGYEAYAQAAELLRQAGQEAATDAFVEAQSWGTPRQILDKLERRRETIGDFELNAITSFAGLPFADAEASLRLFAREVLPEIRAWNEDSFEPVRAQA